jgi:hypothetical protein
MNSTRTPYDKDAYNISQRPKYLVSKIMSLVDDNKEKLQENDYLDMCKFLKSVYELDDEEEYREEFYKIVLNIHLYNVLDEKIKEKLMSFISNCAILIEEEEDDVDLHEDDINNIILTETIDKLNLDKCKELIEKLGGEEECIKLLKYYKKENEQFIQKVINKDFEEEISYYRCLAFYGIHRHTFEWEQIELDRHAAHPAAFKNDFIYHLSNYDDL